MTSEPHNNADRRWLYREIIGALLALTVVIIGGLVLHALGVG